MINAGSSYAYYRMNSIYVGVAGAPTDVRDLVGECVCQEQR